MSTSDSPLRRTAVSALITLGLLVSVSAFGARPTRQLVDIMVWGASSDIDLQQYSPDLRVQIEQHQRRSSSFKSKRQEPTGDSLLMMVHSAQVSYERRLAATSTSPNAPALASAYVTDLKPCYEWEGYSECPRREALFAAKYQSTHPTGPFSAYLPLLEAHRWLCAAEGFEREHAPSDAVDSRERYRKALSVARTSVSPLVKVAAVELEKRGRCYSEDSN